MYTLISIRPKNVIKIIKRGLTKKEAQDLKDEWEKLFEDVYPEEYRPKLKIKEDSQVED